MLYCLSKHLHPQTWFPITGRDLKMNISQLLLIFSVSRFHTPSTQLIYSSSQVVMLHMLSYSSFHQEAAQKKTFMELSISIIGLGTNLLSSLYCSFIHESLQLGNGSFNLQKFGLHQWLLLGTYAPCGHNEILAISERAE